MVRFQLRWVLKGKPLAYLVLGSSSSFFPYKDVLINFALLVHSSEVAKKVKVTNTDNLTSYLRNYNDVNFRLS